MSLDQLGSLLMPLPLCIMSKLCVFVMHLNWPLQRPKPQIRGPRWPHCTAKMAQLLLMGVRGAGPPPPGDPPAAL